ncbi:MAG: hypothetical protein H0V81_04405 [Solirubrobacterales bacterium]|nr:hypothetical protein [Solirubrobacterales bacterium]
MASLRPEYGPELPVLVARRMRWPERRTRIVILGLFAALVLLQGARSLATSGSGLTDLLVTEPFAFTLGYRDGMERVRPEPGEVLRLVSKPGGSTDETFTVSELSLPPYTGDPAGVLPVLAGREVEALREEFPVGFRYRGDARTRINDFPGHQILFQTRLGGRLYYGKRYLLLPEYEAPGPPPREGAELTLLSKYSKATPSVGAVGSFGLMKSALRSFRLGTERP